MDKYTQEIFDKTVEECAEVIHAISKVKRFGPDNTNPSTNEVNKVHLIKEIIQLEALLKKAKEQIPRPTKREMVDVVLQWYKDTPLRFREEFSEAKFDELAIYHHTLGRDIRNHFGLWMYPWEPKIVNDVDMSEEHPDAISMKVIEETWRQVQHD